MAPLHPGDQEGCVAEKAIAVSDGKLHRRCTERHNQIEGTSRPAIGQEVYECLMMFRPFAEVCLRGHLVQVDCIGPERVNSARKAAITAPLRDTLRPYESRISARLGGFLTCGAWAVGSAIKTSRIRMRIRERMRNIRTSYQVES
jgi:hypothetical protein